MGLLVGFLLSSGDVTDGLEGADTRIKREELVMAKRGKQNLGGRFVFRPNDIFLFAIGSCCVAGLSVSAAFAPWLCSWLILTLAFLVAWIVSLRLSRDPLGPLFLISGYCFLGIGVRGIAVYEGWAVNRFNAPIGDDGLVVEVFLAGALALISCTLGYAGSAGGTLSRKWQDWNWPTASWNPRIVNAYGVLSLGLGLASLYLLRSQFGDVVGFGTSPSIIASRVSKGGISSTEMLAFFPLFSVLLMWGRKELGSPGRLILLGNIGLVGAWFIIAGRKSLLFETIFGLFLLRHYLRKRLGGRVLVVLLVPMLILISVAFYWKAYGFRVHSIEEQYSSQSTANAVLDPLIERSYDFDSAIMILQKTRSINDYRLGSTFEDLLWFYVPRQLWPEKPVSFGFSFASEFLPGANLTESYTPSMVGELYLDFGFLGIIFGFYFLGVLIRALHEALPGKSALSTVVYILVIFRLVNMIEGPITTHLELLLGELLPVILFALVHKMLDLSRGRIGQPSSTQGGLASFSAKTQAIRPF